MYKLVMLQIGKQWQKSSTLGDGEWVEGGRSPQTMFCIQTSSQALLPSVRYEKDPDTVLHRIQDAIEWSHIILCTNNKKPPIKLWPAITYKEHPSF